jgi:hypothetical protein
MLHRTRRRRWLSVQPIIRNRDVTSTHFPDVYLVSPDIHRDFYSVRSVLPSVSRADAPDSAITVLLCGGKAEPLALALLIHSPICLPAD